jgi:hypothetical protein
MNTVIHINDAATPGLERLLGRVERRRPLLAVLGRQLEASLRQHFLLREGEPNKRGWPKQHFWSRIRRATALSSVTATTATVTVTDPALAQKIHGGTIRPRPGRKFLALPLRAEAAGRMPGSGLFFMRTRRGKGLLVAAGRAGRGGPRESVRPYYLLVPGVTQRADPRALPPQAALHAELTQTADDYLALRANEK